MINVFLLGYRYVKCKHHPFKSIDGFFLVVNRFRYKEVDHLAKHLFYNFWWTIVISKLVSFISVTSTQE